MNAFLLLIVVIDRRNGVKILGLHTRHFYTISAYIDLLLENSVKILGLHTRHFLHHFDLYRPAAVSLPTHLLYDTYLYIGKNTRVFYCHLIGSPNYTCI